MNLLFRLSMLTIFLFIGLSAFSQATTLYVDGVIDGVWLGSGAIADAVAEAENELGDPAHTDAYIEVYPGNYKGFAVFKNTVTAKSLLIKAVGPGPSIIDSLNSSAYSAVTIGTGPNLTVTLDGLVFENLSLLLGFGALVVTPHDDTDSSTGSDPVIRNCIFRDNSTAGGYAGGGIAARIGPACDPTFENCEFLRTDGNVFGAVWAYGDYDYPFAGDPDEFQIVASEWFPNPTFLDCTFEDNVADLVSDSAGGALSFTGSKGLVKNCTFISNSSTHGGGAIYGRFVDGLRIEDCTFTGNDSTDHIGGAIYINREGGSGGVEIVNNSFSQNDAVKAGAVCLLNINARISGNCFDENTALSTASALGIRGMVPPSGEDAGALDFTVHVVNNLFTGNSVGGAPADVNDADRCTVRVFSERITGGGTGVCEVEAVMVNNTFADNQDRGVTAREYLGDTVAVTTYNSIYDNNGLAALNASPPLDPVLDINGLDTYADTSGGAGTPSVAFLYSNTEQTGYAGFANISSDPLFVDASTGDYQLTTLSPSVDSGYNVIWTLLSGLSGVPYTDKNGDARVVTTTADMGCYERQ